MVIRKKLPREYINGRFSSFQKSVKKTARLQSDWLFIVCEKCIHFYYNISIQNMSKKTDVAIVALTQMIIIH
jgi:hypothetical protein